jgi:hypothetical protein
MRFANLSVVSTRSAAPPLAIVGGAAVVLGSYLPWMSYFAGLVPLRGVTGLYGRLLLGAGIVGLLFGCGLAWKRAPRVRTYSRRGAALLGLAVAAASAWLLLGVWELTRVSRTNAMLAPRPSAGLLVVLLGGCLLSLAAWVPEREA